MNGNVVSEQDGPYEEGGTLSGGASTLDLGGGRYVTDRGWGLEGSAGKAGGKAGGARREYEWDERDRMITSWDDNYRVAYTYSEDGERRGKHSTGVSGGGESETLYFSKLWTWRYDGLSGDRLGRNSRHIYLGETRLVTKVSRDDGSFTDEEWEKQYWYHGDHLESAQAVTNVRGEEYERIEYTPYGEIWIDNASAASNLDIPYRFTGKERDTETGLYYYGARYPDSKTGRWLSTDPALAEYIPEAPVNDAARKRNGSLPGMGGVYNTINAHLYHYAGNNLVKYTDPDGKWFLIDDLIIAIYLKIKTNSDSSVWDLMIDSFKHSWQHPIEHGKFIKREYDALRDITIPVNEDFEINLNTDIDNREFKFTIRNRKKNTDIPSDEEMSKQIDDLIKKQKGDEIHEN
jgi:RHS repeat-associated protein